MPKSQDATKDIAKDAPAPENAINDTTEPRSYDALDLLREQRTAIKPIRDTGTGSETRLALVDDAEKKPESKPNQKEQSEEQINSERREIGRSWDKAFTNGRDFSEVNQKLSEAVIKAYKAHPHMVSVTILESFVNQNVDTVSKGPIIIKNGNQLEIHHIEPVPKEECDKYMNMAPDKRAADGVLWTAKYNLVKDIAAPHIISGDKLGLQQTKVPSEIGKDWEQAFFGNKNFDAVNKALEDSLIEKYKEHPYSTSIKIFEDAINTEIAVIGKGPLLIKNGNQIEIHNVEFLPKEDAEKHNKMSPEDRNKEGIYWGGWSGINGWVKDVAPAHIIAGDKLGLSPEKDVAEIGSLWDKAFQSGKNFDTANKALEEIVIEDYKRNGMVSMEWREREINQSISTQLKGPVVIKNGNQLEIHNVQFYSKEDGAQFDTLTPKERTEKGVFWSGQYGWVQDIAPAHIIGSDKLGPNLKEDGSEIGRSWEQEFIKNNGKKFDSFNNELEETIIREYKASPHTIHLRVLEISVQKNVPLQDKGPVIIKNGNQIEIHNVNYIPNENREAYDKMSPDERAKNGIFWASRSGEYGWVKDIAPPHIIPGDKLNLKAEKADSEVGNSWDNAFYKNDGKNFDSFNKEIESKILDEYKKGQIIGAGAWLLRVNTTIATLQKGPLLTKNGDQLELHHAEFFSEEDNATYDKLTDQERAKEGLFKTAFGWTKDLPNVKPYIIKLPK